jgi:hypothetical protein
MGSTSHRQPKSERPPDQLLSDGNPSTIFAPIWSPKVGEKQQGELAGLIPDRTPDEKTKEISQGVDFSIHVSGASPYRLT